MMGTTVETGTRPVHVMSSLNARRAPAFAFVRSSRSSRRELTAALLLLVLATLGTESFAAHTDDGCDVEQHCVVCRAAADGVATADASGPRLPTPLIQPVLVQWVVVDAPSAEQPSGPSRAPPLS